MLMYFLKQAKCNSELQDLKLFFLNLGPFYSQLTNSIWLLSKRNNTTSWILSLSTCSCFPLMIWLFIFHFQIRLRGKNSMSCKKKKKKKKTKKKL